MYEREENAQFSLISYSKERPFRVYQTLPDSSKNKKQLQVLTWFLELEYYRDYLGEIWRNSKIHDCQPILENYRHWLLSLSGINKFKYERENEINSGLSTVKIRQHGNSLFMTLLWFQKTQECVEMWIKKVISKSQ